MSSRRYRRLDDDNRGSMLGVIVFGAFVAAILGWAIATTVIAANRVDPPGTFQCGAATGIDGDRCVNYIIVGGGTAGLAAARRLTDDPTKSVMVIEAGPDYGNGPATNNIGDVFSAIGGLWYNTPGKYHTGYVGVPEPGLLNKNLNHLNGRLLGGSSQINYMVQYRGTQTMWDAFDTAVGSPGTFTGAAMYQTFEDLEYLGDNHYTNVVTRGNGARPTQTWKIGALPPGTNDGTDPWTMSSLISNSLGLTEYDTESYNQPGNDVGTFPYVELLYDFNSTPPLTRWSSRLAFMNPSVMDQSTHKGVFPRQLDVLTESTVTRLLTIGTQVIGVEFRGRDGLCHKVYATHEVILSAYLNSAVIMQRSGMGPGTVLADAGIAPVLINENIGQNMKVHGTLQLPNYWGNITGSGEGLPLAPSLAFSMSTDVTGISTPSSRSFMNWVFAFNGVPGIMVLAPWQPFPVSLGYIKVSSPDPFMNPLVLSGLLSNTSDMISYRENVRALYLSILAYDPFFLPLTLDNATLYDDAALDTFIRDAMEVQYHYFDMTKMGTSAATSVVDARFRVHGVTGLRVCDTGVLSPTDGNPSLPVSAIGDICGRLVLEDSGSTYARKAHRAPVSPQKARKTEAERPRQSMSHAARAAPTSQEICSSIAAYIAWLRSSDPDHSQRRIDAILNGPVYSANGCTSV
jgi:choline dehydrogenase